MDTFQTLAEVSVAMAGFSSIVVFFKRRETDIWQKSDADRFHGMILHSMLAVLFAFLPSAFANFDIDTETTFRWCSSLLAVVTGLQVVVTSRLEASNSTTGAHWWSVHFALAGSGWIRCFPRAGLGHIFLRGSLALGSGWCIVRNADLDTKLVDREIDA